MIYGLLHTFRTGSVYSTITVTMERFFAIVFPFREFHKPKRFLGFCVIEYYTREDCEAAMAYINGMRIDDRIIRSDYDAGFTEGRQYGRARAGDRFETRC